jgi:hypothetical protein
MFSCDEMCNFKRLKINHNSKYGILVFIVKIKIYNP